jgi:hypothetical protein
MPLFAIDLGGLLKPLETGAGLFWKRFGQKLPNPALGGNAQNGLLKRPYRLAFQAKNTQNVKVL